MEIVRVIKADQKADKKDGNFENIEKEKTDYNSDLPTSTFI
jgi:hypothetical protein